MMLDVDPITIARAFGRTLWNLKDMERDEVIASARRFAEGIPFLVTDVETFCESVAHGYAEAEAEYQQQQATLH